MAIGTGIIARRFIIVVLVSVLALLSFGKQCHSKILPRHYDHQEHHGRGLAADTCGAHNPTCGVNYKIVDVMHFGAKANEKDDDVEAFMQAWQAACKKSPEPAKLLVPEGTYMTSPVIFQGPCLSTVPVIVEVKGTIIASDDLSTYAEDSWFLFEKINGLILTGGGTFDGRGAAAWKYNDGGGSNLPTSIKMSAVENAVVHDVCSLNSKFFHYHVTDSANFTAYNLRITAPCESPNTDGIHLSSTCGVQISNSVIGTGDDCISVGHGVTNAKIFGITCGPGHGISIGSLGKREQETDLRGVTISNCTLTNTTNGARIKAYASKIPLKASDITFEDIIMNDVQNPIIIDQNYGSKKKKGASRVKISNVHYKRIRGTTPSNVPITLACSPAEPCDGIEFYDVSLDLATPAAVTSRKKRLNTSFTACCANAQTTFSGTNKIPICE